MDRDAAVAGAIVLAAGFGSAILTALMRDWLRRRAILDRPGERSSHVRPVPRGAGLAVIAALVVAWLALAARGTMPSDAIVVALVTAALALLSFADDLRGLPVAVRLAAHFVAALIALASFSSKVVRPTRSRFAAEAWATTAATPPRRTADAARTPTRTSAIRRTAPTTNRGS